MATLQIVKIFDEIRDIPYRIPMSLDEVDHCCSGKAILMKNKLEALGFQVRYRVCRFRWSEMGLPKELEQIPHGDDCTHVFLEVFVDGGWLQVDPTWDIGINAILPVATWNGINDTILAVKPYELLDIELSRKIMEESSSEEILEDLRVNGDFYVAFNGWLEGVRSR